MSPSWTQTLAGRIRDTGSALCVGLDPRPDQTPGDLESFLRRVIEETAPFTAVYKPNIAYYEALGIRGLELLQRLLRDAVPPEIPVLLDAKRSDIPATQEAYARACFDVWGADAVTVNPLLGWDSIEPYFRCEGRGVYLLCITSNPGASDFLLAGPPPAPPLFEQIQALAERARDMPADAGLVAGLTQLSPSVAGRLADLPLLIPGLGAQGGSLDALAAWGGTSPCLINVSRGILYRDMDRSFADKARDAARTIAGALRLPGPA